MTEFLVLFFITFMFLWISYRYYEPKIEIVVLVKHYRVYLWYNKYDGSNYKVRVYKFLFEI